MFLSPSDEEEKRIHGDPTKQQWRNTEVSQWRWQSSLPPKKIQPFIDGRGAKPSPIRILNPREIGSHPENFDQPRNHNINRCRHTISIIMTAGPEAPVTNFKKINRSACQLSGSSATSKLIQTIHIYFQDLPLPTSIKAKKSTDSTILTSLSLAPTSKRAREICSGQKIDHHVTCPSNQEALPLHILSETVRSTLKSLFTPKMHPRQQPRCSKSSRRLQLRTRQPQQQIILISARTYANKSSAMFMTCHALQPG